VGAEATTLGTAGTEVVGGVDASVSANFTIFAGSKLVVAGELTVVAMGDETATIVAGVSFGTIAGFSVTGLATPPALLAVRPFQRCGHVSVVLPFWQSPRSAH
jgi:hypothetical protein